MEVGVNSRPLYDPELHRPDEEPPDLRDLNTALFTLADMFPDIEPDLIREMLISVSEESRLQVVTEQMLKKETGVGCPRLLQRRRPFKTTSPRGGKQQPSLLRLEETFRGEEYRKAVKQVFYAEFKNLSHSQVRTVMLEANSSYTLARPILQQLSSRSWRLNFTNFWPKRSHQNFAGNDHPNIYWRPDLNVDGGVAPVIRQTGSTQLDHELHEIFVEPVRKKQRQKLLFADHAYASQVNEMDAEAAGAVFDCECCYSSVPFEQLATCDEGCHQLCFGCVGRTVHEALYGQGWARAASIEKCTVRCFSPVNQECHGCIPADTARRALIGGSENEDIWHEFQRRVADEVLLKSRVPLQRCPFCNYAEIAETPRPRLRSLRHIWLHLMRKSPAALQILVISLIAALFICTVPLMILISIAWLLVLTVPKAATVINASWSRVYNHRRGPRFTCRHPSCNTVSCVRCNTAWRDPHTCFENEKTSLRTAIEASATAAVKRTCPKCHLSFVKSSGCNKLVCNCGYTMCYICRQEITSNVGYTHFCQHFRPSGGQCGECARCDLYGDEDEGAAITKAVELAEKAWQEIEGRKGEDGDPIAAQLMVEALVGPRQHVRRRERWVDLVVDALYD